MSPGSMPVEYLTRTSARRSSRESATFGGLDSLSGVGDRLGQEASGLPDQLSVGVDLAPRAKVADHVPVQPGRVRPAGLWEGRAEREMHRPADLFVEEDVAGEAVDLVVEPEGDFAEDAGAFVHVKQRAQVIVPARGLRGDHPPGLEPQAHVLDLVPVIDGGEGVADLTLRLGLDRAREDLAVRHVEATVRGDPFATLDADDQVGVGPHDPELAN